jgi:hypothetical protein
LLCNPIDQPMQRDRQSVIRALGYCVGRKPTVLPVARPLGLVMSNDNPRWNTGDGSACFDGLKNDRI